MNRKIDLGKILEFQRRFTKERKWEKYHTPKNLAMALSVEASELMEHFQWLTAKEAKAIMKNPAKAREVSNELADILYYLVRLADMLRVDLEEAFWEKTKENAAKYPVKLAKGNMKKYTEYKRKN